MTGITIDSLARKLAEAVPQGMQSLREDLESNFRSVLRAGLGRLDLVTREEFDVQQAVLLRTRQKLTALEARLAVLEGATGKPAGDGEKMAKRKKAAGKTAGGKKKKPRRKKPAE